MLGINQPAVTIKQVEVSIIDQAFENGWVQPHPPQRLTGKTVAVVGSGPAGLAAAQQLTRAGHTVAVYERDDRIGGLIRYGIPEFKMEKHRLDQRLNQMIAEGTRFRAGVEIGRDIAWDELRRRYDAVVVATGAPVPRDLPVPGRDLDGVHFAMEYLTQSNKAVAGDDVPAQITAEDRHVVVIGGGDTGADCIGTAHRQGAASVTNLAIGRQPPATRSDSQPWPMMPTVFEISSAHEEGGRREYLASTVEFVDDGHGRVTAAPRRGDRVPRRQARAARRHRAADPRRPRADRDGLHRPGAGAARRPARAAVRRPRHRRRATTASRPRSRACSSPATPVAASR